MCLYLHSNEQTGCLVCLQYRFAEPLQLTHHPNLPDGISCSLTIEILSNFLEFDLSSSPFFLDFDDLGTIYRDTASSSS